MRVNGFTVVLDKDYKDEGYQAIKEAIGMIKGVLSVTEHEADLNSHMAEERAKRELGEKLFAVLYPKT